MPDADSEALREAFRRKILNQERSLSEFLARKTALESRPSKVVLELAKYQLWRNASKDKAVMAEHVLESAAAALFPDAYFVSVHGFERRLLASRWHRILDLFERYPAVNWHLWTHFSIEDHEVWRRMVDLGFIFGFDCAGVTAASVAEARKISDFHLEDKRAFDVMMRNARAVGERIRAEGRGMLYFMVTILESNLSELEDVVRLAADCGAHDLQLKVMHDFSDFDGAEERLPPVIERCLDLAIERNLKTTLNDHEMFKRIDVAKIVRAAKIIPGKPGLNFPPPETFDPEFARRHSWSRTDTRVRDHGKVSLYKKCFKPFHLTHVAPDGKVGTCNYMMDPEIIEMGDLASAPFDAIWNGPLYQEFRKNLLDGAPTDPRCKWCFERRMDD